MLLLCKDPVRRLRQVLSGKIRVPEIRGALVAGVIRSKTASDQDGPRACPMPQFHIAPFVPYHE